MKKLLFLGEQKNSYFIKEAANQYGCEIEISGYVVSLTSMVDRALVDNYDYILIDVSGLLMSPLDLKECVEQILIGSQARVAVMGQGMSMTTAIIQAAVEAGIHNVLLSVYPREISEDCIEFLSGNSNIETKKDQMNNTVYDEVKIMPFAKINIERTTIGVAGTIERIGVTTQAIQLCKWLKMKGKNVCYIQMNDSGYVENLKVFYENVVVDEAQGCVSYENVEMYYDKARIDEILNRNYDFYVYDYGTITNEYFQKTSFFEKNYKIVVTGTKPTELNSFNQCMEELYHKHIHYVFSFVSEGDRENVMEMMSDKDKYSYLAGVTLDMFSLNSDNISNFEKIIPLEEEIEEEPEKKGLFSFLKKDTSEKLKYKKEKKPKEKKKKRKKKEDTKNEFENEKTNTHISTEYTEEVGIKEELTQEKGQLYGQV
ncbi:MAG: hypothetical protein UHK60_03795 [Acutalibacteraceae bacterium]|nr:hypothetical protein [Acutalibacteraceae bacterium]